MRHTREDGRFLKILLDAFAFCLTKIKHNTRRSFKNCKKGRKERKTIQRCTESARDEQDTDSRGWQRYACPCSLPRLRPGQGVNAFLGLQRIMAVRNCWV